MFTLPIAPAIEFKGNNERIKELEKSYNEAARLARALMRDEQCTSRPPIHPYSFISPSRQVAHLYARVAYASASLAMGEQLSAIGAPEKLKSIAGTSTTPHLALTDCHTALTIMYPTDPRSRRTRPGAVRRRADHAGPGSRRIRTQ